MLVNFVLLHRGAASLTTYVLRHANNTWMFFNVSCETNTCIYTLGVVHFITAFYSWSDFRNVQHQNGILSKNTKFLKLLPTLLYTCLATRILLPIQTINSVGSVWLFTVCNKCKLTLLNKKNPFQTSSRLRKNKHH